MTVRIRVPELMAGVLPADRGPRTRDDLIAAHRELGRRCLLAPHWPRAFGGLDAAFADSAAVVEQLVLAGYTDTLIVNSIYNVGHALLRHCKDRSGDLIRDIALGKVFAAVLFTEAGAGSDLTLVQTLAAPLDDGWVVSGEKTWIAQADLCEFGVCLARTSGSPGEVWGLSQFLVPLHQPGITVTALDTVWREPLFSIRFDEVHLPSHALVGGKDEAWELVPELLMMERASPGYWIRGLRWCNALCSGGVEVSADLLYELAVAQALSSMAVDAVTAAQMDPMPVAMAKYQGVLVSQRVAALAAATGWPEAYQWHTEAAGMALAAGSAEMMLRHIVTDLKDLLDDPGF